MGYYVIGDYDGLYNTLGLETQKAIKDCKSMIDWQGQGQFYGPYHICTMDPEERGTFVSIETGDRFPTHRGPFTEDAYEGFLERLWGPEPTAGMNP